MWTLHEGRDAEPPWCQTKDSTTGTCSSRCLKPMVKPIQSFMVTDQHHAHPPRGGHPDAQCWLHAQMATQMVSLLPLTARDLHMHREDKGLGRSFPAFLHLSSHGDQVMLSPALIPCPCSCLFGLPSPILSTLCFDLEQDAEPVRWQRVEQEWWDQEEKSTSSCGSG